jgi:hypothetical protein
MRLLVLALLVVSSGAFAQHSGFRWARHFERSSGFPIGLGFGPYVGALRTDLQGWGVVGRDYEVSCDRVSTSCGVALLRSKGWSRGDSGGALLHSESALPWRGVKISLRGELRAGAVAQRASLVVLVYGADGKVLTSARSEPLTGTTSYGWQRVTLIVPDGAEKLSVGVELVGVGAVFVREVSFDEADVT